MIGHRDHGRRNTAKSRTQPQRATAKRNAFVSFDRCSRAVGRTPRAAGPTRLVARLRAAPPAPPRCHPPTRPPPAPPAAASTGRSPRWVSRRWASALDVTAGIAHQALGLTINKRSVGWRSQCWLCHAAVADSTSRRRRSVLPTVRKAAGGARATVDRQWRKRRAPKTRSTGGIVSTLGITGKSGPSRAGSLGVQRIVWAARGGVLTVRSGAHALGRLSPDRRFVPRTRWPGGEVARCEAIRRRPRPRDGNRGVAQARSTASPKGDRRECNPGKRWAATIGMIQMSPRQSRGPRRRVAESDRRPHQLKVRTGASTVAQLS
jgi:hypothetical protein